MKYKVWTRILAGFDGISLWEGSFDITAESQIKANIEAIKLAQDLNVYSSENTVEVLGIESMNE